jgi:predicted dehydrogenase
MKFLIIGLGSIGKRHLQNIQQISSEHEIIALRSKRDSVKFRDVKEFYNLADALAEKPDTALICNPTNLHIDTALKLAEEGIHLFIEKPISNNLNDLSSLIKIVEEKNLISMVGYPLRFHPIIKKAKELVDRQILGKAYFARVQVGYYLPLWRPDTDYRQSYSARKDLGGGVVLDLSHEIDYVQWLFGNVTYLTAYIDKISELDIDTEDYAEILIEFENKICAEVHLDYLQQTLTRDGQIICENGTIDFDLEKKWLNIHQTGKNDSRINIENYNKNEMYIDEIKHFIECVNKGLQTSIDIKEGIKTMNIIQASKISSEKNQKIKLKSILNPE